MRGVHAFNRSGLFSVTVAMPRSARTRICSKVIGIACCRDAEWCPHDPRSTHGIALRGTGTACIHDVSKSRQRQGLAQRCQRPRRAVACHTADFVWGDPLPGRDRSRDAPAIRAGSRAIALDHHFTPNSRAPARSPQVAPRSRDRFRFRAQRQRPDGHDATRRRWSPVP